MEMLGYFFTCYFNYIAQDHELDDLIEKFKENVSPAHYLNFIRELDQIIQANNYTYANKIIEETQMLTYKNYLKELEIILNHIYNRLIERPRKVKGVNFTRHLKYILCPNCSPGEKKRYPYSVIEKATISNNNMIVYICKPCSLVWLTDDISLENARNYKKYMNSLGLAGFWKELQDRDIY